MVGSFMCFIDIDTMFDMLLTVVVQSIHQSSTSHVLVDINKFGNAYYTVHKNCCGWAWSSMEPQSHGFPWKKVERSGAIVALQGCKEAVSFR